MLMTFFMKIKKNLKAEIKAKAIIRLVCLWQNAGIKQSRI